MELKLRSPDTSYLWKTMARRSASRKILRQQRQQLINEARDKVIAQLMLLRLRGERSEWVKKVLDAVEQETRYGVLAQVLENLKTITALTPDEPLTTTAFMTRHIAIHEVELAVGLRAAKLFGTSPSFIFDDRIDHQLDSARYAHNSRSSPPQAQNSRPPKKLVR
jgi:hypothetical protein